jgi:hypothetical protein
MKAICTITVVVAALCAQAQDIHQWRAAFTVTDDSGNWLPAAKVSVFYDVPPQNASNESGKITGLTDANGLFTASHEDKTFRLRFLIQKSGYYSTDIKDDFHGAFTPEHLNRDVTIVLKKITNPIPMYAKWVDTWPLKGDGSAWLNLTTGHWIAQNNGDADIFFTSKTDKRSAADFDHTLSISFPNPGDGIQEYIPSEGENGNQLRSTLEAPANGYQSQLVRTNSARPNGAGLADYNENRVYFIRVRTVLDQMGNVKSALYGKIYGDPIFLNFYYYLNPTPNNRNIEFDPKQNLIKSHSLETDVRRP